MASLYLQLGDPTSARAELVKARNLQPENPTTWFNLGNFDFFHGHVVRSLPEFNRTIELDHTLDTMHSTAISGAQQAQAAAAGKHSTTGSPAG